METIGIVNIKMSKIIAHASLVPRPLITSLCTCVRLCVTPQRFHILNCQLKKINIKSFHEMIFILCACYTAGLVDFNLHTLWYMTCAHIVLTSNYETR